MTEELRKAIKSYNDYVRREFDEEPKTSEELDGILPILSSTFELEDQEDEIEIEVVYLLQAGNYVITINDGLKEINFTDDADLKQFTEDMRGGTFESLYNYFVDLVREKYDTTRM